MKLPFRGFRHASLAAQYRSELERQLARATEAPPVQASDLERLPLLVRGYLERAGVVGRPKVANFHAVFSGRIRSGPDKPWLAGTIDQHSFYSPEARLFFMRTSVAKIPLHVYHRYVGDAASMQVRAADFITIVNAGGPELTQSETVTLLNDRCLLAPATLLDPSLHFVPLDERRVRVDFENAGHRVSAELDFDAAGDLVGFVSNDRYQSDGKTHRLLPWSTPVRSFGDFEGVRLVKDAEARWREANGEWIYAEFRLESIAYNVRGDG